MTALWLLLRAIPLRTWLIVALIGASVGWVVQMRSRAFDAGYAKRDNEQKIVDAAEVVAAAALVEKSDKVTDRVVTKTVEVVRTIQGKTITLIQKVPVYVPNDACPIDGSYRLLTDAAALQAGPVPAR